MSATRLLVLGVVRGYGRTHGYRIGTDLLSWGAGDWANVKWGSIYHALRTLTAAGSLVDHLDVPGRTDYEITERGEPLAQQPHRLVAGQRGELGAALTMLPALSRDEAVRLLRERLAALEEIRDKAQGRLDEQAERPHWSELFGLWRDTAEGGIAWTAGLIGRLESGAYAMGGEPGSPGRPGSWPSLKE
jgi:DNA-binding PadR family transcriptional regulator